MANMNQDQGEPDLIGIVFRTGDEGYQREQYIKIFKYGVIATRYLDEECLRKLGLLQRIPCFSDSLVSHLQKLTLEFLSSYSYETPGDEGMYLTGATKFHMFNTEYALTQEQLTNMLEFSRAEAPNSVEIMYKPT